MASSIPSLHGWMNGVGSIAGLPTTEGGFNIIQNHINLLLGKVH